MVGVGIDIVDIARFERLVERGGDRLWTHWYTDVEASEARRHARPAVAAATRFAIKEAAYKALGADFAGPVRWRDIEVRAELNGWRLVLDGEVREAADRAGAHTLHVSTSRVGGRVLATVVATGAVTGADLPPGQPARHESHPNSATTRGQS